MLYATEYFGFSGLISIFIYIIIQTNYTRTILKEESKQSVETLLKTANFLCEGIAFVYLGFNSVKIMSTTSIASDLIVSLFIMFSICLVRWISIGMPAFLFLCYENIKIEVQDIVLIWYSGLIRGAIAFALSQ